MRLLSLALIFTAMITPIAISIDLSPPANAIDITRQNTITGFSDPADPRLRFRIIPICNPKTGMGSLCHYLAFFDPGGQIEFSDPVCFPITCPVKRVIPPKRGAL